MDTFFTGFIFGIISSLAIYIFIQSVRRGKADTSESIKERIDRNNISTERGLGSLRTNNKEAGEVARRGLETIEDTNRTVSEIIAAAKREGQADD